MSDHRKASQGDDLHVDDLHVKAKQARTGTTIIVVGEFDMTSVEVFWAHMSEAVEARPVSITVEARGLTFIDSSGLMALARAREAATGAGVTFRVSEPSPPLRRVAEMCGLEDLLAVE